MSSNNAQIEL